MVKPISGMVDNSDKDITKRFALASGSIVMSKSAFKILMREGSPKGNVWEAAKLAGVMAAKKTPELIPMCHPLELGKVSITFDIDRVQNIIQIKSEVAYEGKTGVEMEALIAVSVAALTIYDMMKWSDRTMVISEIKLLYKAGGKSGEYKRKI